MKVHLIEEDVISARMKWRQYTEAVKKHPKVTMYKELKALYYQMKQGKKLIDITQVIPAGGVHDGADGPNARMPKLAIARADQKTIRCNCWPNGKTAFVHPSLPARYDIAIANAFPTWNWADKQMWRSKDGSAPVPMIPPHLKPDVLSDDYYILWEVDQWKMEPPIDPWLLRRITKTIFIVLAAWDLTELERRVMASRLVTS